MPSSRPFNHITDLEKINSIDDILAELGYHEFTMKQTKINRLLYFSRTYAVINQAVSFHIESGGFNHPTIMQELQINFARLYFDMLNEYARNGSLPASWWVATKSWPASSSLFLAIRAHIICDAHIAITQLSNSAFLERDYLAVDRLILQSTKTVVITYSPSRLLRPIREIARKLMIKPICSVIFMMRHSGWERHMRATRAAKKREALVISTIFPGSD